MKSTLPILLCGLATLSNQAVAEDDCIKRNVLSEPKWKLLIENDVLALDSWTGLNDDRNYTMGVIVSTYGDRARNGLMARALATIDGWWSLSDGQSYFCSYAQNDYGVSAFTPNILEQSEPIFGDRPYASLMYVSNLKTRVFENRAVRTRVVAGVLGLDVAKAVQRFLHNQLSISDQDPLGWNNQISEGGEPTGMYVFETVRQFSSPGNAPKFGGPIEFSYKYGFNAGYYTNVYGGLGLRFGRINTPYHAWDANAGSIGSQNFLNLGMDGSTTKPEFFGFVAYLARAVGYNVLLQGQFRDSVVKFDSSEIERIVHEVSAGVTYARPSGSVWTFAMQYRSPEFEGPFSREHWFGGITYSKGIGKKD